MEAEQRQNRKRKAEEADICQFDNLEAKRVKLSSIPNNEQINKSNNSIANEPNNNPFASFANQGNGFQSLIHKNQSTTQESFPLSESPNIESKEEKPQQKQKQEERQQDNTSLNCSKSNNIEGVDSLWNNNNKNEKNNDNDNDFKFDANDSQFSMTDFPANNNNKNKNKGWGNSNNEFKFDASDSQFSMADFAANNNNKKNKNGFESENEIEDEKPIATLMGKVDSGDKNDKTIFNIKCTVYELDIKNYKYKERGNGNVRLNTYLLNNKVHARLLCRKDVTFKTLINAVLMKETKFEKVTDKSARFTAFEQQQVTGEGDSDVVMKTVNVTKTFLLKSKKGDKTKMDDFLAKIKKVQEKM